MFADLTRNRVDVLLRARNPSKSRGNDEAFVIGNRPSQSRATANVATGFTNELETYRGILIMTTTDIWEFDRSLVTRMHRVVVFDGLTMQEENSIWHSHCDDPKFELKDYGSHNSITQWIKSGKPQTYRLTAREIQNIFRMAKTLAYEDGEGITLDHILQCYEPVIEIRRHLQKGT